MSCNACTRRYGFFCKELGCPNCGYSFCTKCLKKEIEVPRCNNAKLKVCLKCFEKLEKLKLKSTTPEIQKNTPTENEIFSIDEPLETPVLEPIHTADDAVKQLPSDNEIDDNLDCIISKRLAGLKESTDPNLLPSDTDMAGRLASLKGIPYKDYSKSDVLLSKDVRTDQDKINDLLKQFVEEKEIDEKVTREDPIIEIEKRLAALRNKDSSSGNQMGANTIPENDDSLSVSKVVQRYLEEAKLPDALISEEEKELISSLPPPSKDTEELPWCTICNEDAVLRCIGCDGDLFCRNCFKECHDDEDFREHQTQTYSKPTNFIENHF